MNRIARAWVSPRKRARQTYRLLFFGGDGEGEGEGEGDGDSDGHGDGYDKSDVIEKVEKKMMMTLTNDIAEWDYGDYEGLVVDEIRALRKEKGLDREREWDIWKDGCEGGEYVCRIHSLTNFTNVFSAPVTL